MTLLVICALLPAPPQVALGNCYLHPGNNLGLWQVWRTSRPPPDPLMESASIPSSPGLLPFPYLGWWVLWGTKGDRSPLI